MLRGEQALPRDDAVVAVSTSPSAVCRRMLNRGTSHTAHAGSRSGGSASCLRGRGEAGRQTPRRRRGPRRPGPVGCAAPPACASSRRARARAPPTARCRPRPRRRGRLPHARSDRRAHHRAHHQRGRPVELRGRRPRHLRRVGPTRLGARQVGSGLLQALERTRPDDSKPPWVGEMMVGRPASQFEQIHERFPLDGPRVECLDRPPRADGLLTSTASTLPP